MEITPEDFRCHFELLSDEALLDTNRDDLVDLAKQSYDEEVLRRGLNESGDAESQEVEATTAATRPRSRRPNPGKLSDADTFVQIAKFHSRSEFEIASALLRSAEIACRQGSRIGRRIELELPLMVPAPFAQEALELLRTQISEEELDVFAETTIPATDLMEEEPVEEESTDRDV